MKLKPCPFCGSDKVYMEKKVFLFFVTAAKYLFFLHRLMK